MISWWFGLVLCVLVAAPAVASERVEAILADQRQNGYRSPAAAIARLQAASDVPGAAAPLDIRRRFHASLAGYSLKTRQPELTADALAKLEAMASREQCRACAVSSLIVQAHGALNRRQTKEALGYLMRARPLADPADLSLGLELSYAEARLQDAMSNLTKAMEIALPATRLAEQIGHGADRVRLMTLMAGLNADLGNLPRASKLVEEALAMAEPMGFVHATGMLWLLRSYVHALSGERDQQYQSLLQALKIAAGDPGLADVEITSRSNLADYFLHTRDFSQARAYAIQAAVLAERIGDEQALGVAKANEGIALAGLGDVAGGIAALEASIVLVEKVGHKVLEIAITQELVRVLEDSGRYREALQATQKIASVNAEITAQERDTAAMALQATYDAERKDREIERLSAQNQLRLAEVSARTWQQRLWAALAVALALAAIPLVQWLKRARSSIRRLKGDNSVLTAQSVHDPLTGAYNRRHCQALMAQQEVLLAGRTPDSADAMPVGLILIDLDFFKAVNDTHGHAAGDAVLVEISRRLHGLVRQQDAVVRWGGEEFVLVLPGTAVTDLATLVDRVLRAIGAAPVMVGDVRVPITASAGCVVYPFSPNQHWEDALHVADLALYQSKASGRNRATCLVRVDPDAHLDRGRGDLAGAVACGDIELETVLGPMPEPEPPMPPPAGGQIEKLPASA